MPAVYFLVELESSAAVALPDAVSAAADAAAMDATDIVVATAALVVGTAAVFAISFLSCISSFSALASLLLLNPSLTNCLWLLHHRVTTHRTW